MDYVNIATTVFTPFEYGCVGLSEEEATTVYGASNIEVFLSEFSNLELDAVHRPKAAATRADEFDVDMSANSLSKLVCLKDDGAGKQMKVVGFHFVGKNAGEIAQGMALALRLGVTKVGSSLQRGSSAFGRQMNAARKENLPGTGRGGETTVLAQAGSPMWCSWE
eukprot:GHVT01089557.1.p1 GENE.GHVT01089557.1~~GHVT01089557.1.p1  ORF type:complete len:165 (+),score=38.97 GHVT01089557.1:693-1187(+)